MKKIVVLISVFLFFITNISVCAAPGVSASSAVLIECSTGRVLYEKNSDVRLSMASTTKIMTALCAIENSNLDSEITVDPSAVGVEGSSIYLKKGEKLTIEELVYGLMLSSGNDAAVAIACAVSGSVKKFADLMNLTAEKIGVKNTHFMNPNGLDQDGHYTTAYDLAQITAYAMKNERFRKIVSTYETTISYDGCSYDRHLRNHNKLLKMYDGCIGVKTGFTKKSGRCLVSAAEKNGITLIAVTLKAPDDWNDHTAMLNYGFENVSIREVAKKDGYICTIPVKEGTEKYVRLVYENDLSVPEFNGSEDKVTVKNKTKAYLKAPVSFRQNVGKVEFYINGKLYGKVNAVADAVVAKDDSKNLKRTARLILTEFVLSAY